MKYISLSLSLLAAAATAAFAATPTTVPSIDLYFEPNLGQAGPDVQFIARGAGGTTLFTQDKTVFANLNAALTFKGAKPITNFEPLEELPGVSAYFTGNDPSKWLHKVPHYSKLRARNVYEGIDLVYYAKGTQLEYDLIVHPHADPTKIQLAFEGLKSIQVTAAGDLQLTPQTGEPFIQHKPHVFQTINGSTKAVSSTYRIESSGATIVLANYDRTQPLTIDPMIQFGRFFPGSTFTGVTTDQSNAVYVVGSSPTIPTVGQISSEAGSSGGLIAKYVVDPVSRAATLIYAIHINGSPLDIAVDAAGAAYVTGNTNAANFPEVHPLPPVTTANNRPFVLKLIFEPNSRAITLAYSSRFGDQASFAEQIEVDSAGNACVVGSESQGSSPPFPIVNGLPQASNMTSGLFIIRFQFNASAGNLSIAFSSFLPGLKKPKDYNQDPPALKLGPDGSMYIAGVSSRDLLIINGTPGSRSEEDRGAVMKLVFRNGALSLDYSTSVGLNRFDTAKSLAVDSSGVAYVCGETTSTQLPLTPPPSNPVIVPGAKNIHVESLVFDESRRILDFGFWRTLNGTLDEFCDSIRVAPDAGLILVGRTDSYNFPLIEAIPDFPQDLPQYVRSGFVAKFLPVAPQNVLFSTVYIRDPAAMSQDQVAVDTNGVITIVGQSRGFGPVLGSFPGSDDQASAETRGFMARIVPTSSTSGSTPLLSVNVRGRGTVRSTGGANGNINCGAVCLVTGSGTYTLTAVPDGGDGSVRWDGACTGYGECTITVGSTPRFVGASFDSTRRSLTVWKSGSGSGQITIEQPGGVLVSWDTSQCVTSACTIDLLPGRYKAVAAAASGSRFSEWSGGAATAQYRWSCFGSGDCDFEIVSGANDFGIVARFDLPSRNTNIGLQFLPVAPARQLDSRIDPFPPVIGANPRPMAPLETRSFNFAHTLLGSSARAISLNLTVVPSGPLPFATIFPSGQARPVTSVLNSLDGRIKATAAIVPTGEDGRVNAYVTNTTEAILDVNGYFLEPNLAAGQGLAFYPLKPCRILDTRNPIAPLGGPALLPQASRTIPILTSACNIPSAARAYSLNTTVVPTGPLPYITLYPTGQALPTVSTLNALLGEITANAAIVPAGSNGSIDIYAAAATHLVLDVNGYFAPPGQPGGLLFYPVKPCRILDTRNPTGSFGGPIMGAQETRDFPVPQSACGIPSTAKAYSLNATVVPTGNLPYLTLWPAGDTIPTVSTLNSLDASIVSNAAIVPAGTNGAIRAFTAAQAHLILDINGYFAP